MYKDFLQLGVLAGGDPDSMAFLLDILCCSVVY